jgi:hypothetical protein
MNWKKILIGVAAISVAIQFIPYGRDHTNPEVIAEPMWDSLRTQALFERACNDCHSHETKWPWYSNIAPVSWLVQHDVEEGREHFNVSAWGAQDRNEGDEAAETVREGEMPMWIYLPTHPEARLNASEKQSLIDGLVATFGDKKTDEHGLDEEEDRE